ncbi:MAG: hypothetical protein ACI8QC_004554 [Planctomycetota bacterium]|jgi:hypothetical protein
MQRQIQISMVVTVGLLTAWFATLGPSSPPKLRPALASVLDFDGPAVLEGRVQLDPGTPADVVRVVLDYSEPLGQPRLNQTLSATGEFIFPGVVSGRATLSLVAPEGGPPLVQLKDLEVAGMRADPRLRQLDLRGRLALIPVRVLAPGGEPAEQAMVAWRSSGEQAFRHFRLTQDGSITLVTACDLIDLYIQSEGARSCLIRGVLGEAQVELRPSLEAELELPAEIGPMSTGVSLTGHVSRVTLPTALEGSSSSIVDYLRRVDRVDGSEGDSVTIRVASSGQYTVEWHLWDLEREIKLHFPGKPEPSTFEVRASSPGATVTPSFPLELYRAALATR